MESSQLLATSWLGLGKAETHITEDERGIKDFLKSPSKTSDTYQLLYNMAWREM